MGATFFSHEYVFSTEDYKRLAGWTIRTYFPGYVRDEDMFQEAMIGLWKAVQSYDESRGVKFTTYAITRMRGCCLNELRRRRRQEKLQTVSLSSPIPGTDLTYSDAISDPNDSLAAALGEITAAEMLEAVKGMGLSDRQLNVMGCRIAGHTYDQICENLGIGTGTVCKSMRAIKQAFQVAAAF